MGATTCSIFLLEAHSVSCLWSVVVLIRRFDIQPFVLPTVLDFSLFHPHRQYHSHSPIAQVAKDSENFPMLLYHMDRSTLPRVLAQGTDPGRTTATAASSSSPTQLLPACKVINEYESFSIQENSLLLQKT